MAWFKFPESALMSGLSHATNRVFLTLLQYHFHAAHGKYDEQFYLTDRDLSRVTGCSLRTIWKAKKFLKISNLIDYRVGFKNRTYYSILSPNGKKLHK